MTLVGLKSYNQTVVDNIIADSSHDAGVWVGESGGLGGVYRIERNIFSNFTQKGQCGGGEYSQAGASLCYRDMPMIANNTIGGLLNATYLHGVCINASAPPSDKAACVDPAWFGFSQEELAAPLLTSVNSTLYSAPLDDQKTAALPKLRPDVDSKSIGNVSDPGFARTAYSQWWNRTHLDYALKTSSPAFHPDIGFQATDLETIGLRPSWIARFNASQKGLRPAGATIQSESADRAFGLYLEPSFGISFPTNPGPLAPIAAAAFASYRHVDFGSATRVRVRACLPSKVKPATAIVLREGSPEGPVIARVALPPSLVHANCGYLIGSYWAPGVLNDDPAAMGEASVELEGVTTGRHGVFLSIDGGGHAAIDWFRFE